MGFKGQVTEAIELIGSKEGVLIIWDFDPLPPLSKLMPRLGELPCRISICFEDLFVRSFDLYEYRIQMGTVLGYPKKVRDTSLVPI